MVEVGLRAISTSFAQGTNADQIATAGRIRSTEPILVTASLLKLERCQRENPRGEAGGTKTHEVVGSWPRGGKGQGGTEEEQSGSEVKLHCVG